MAQDRLSRRHVLGGATLAPLLGSVASFAGLLSACGGGSSSPDAQEAVDGPQLLQAATTPNLVGGKYRFQQPYLLQSPPSATIEPRVAGGTPYAWDLYGPTSIFVDVHTGWMWSRPGGDWTDRDGVRHGTTPWFSVLTDKGVGASLVAMYDADITPLAQHVQTSGRWFALLLTARNTYRTIAGRKHPNGFEPYVRIWYVDGSFAYLSTRTLAPLSSSSMPATMASSVPLPAVLEFERPTQAVVRADIVFFVVEHWSGSPPLVEGFLLDPPIHTGAAVLGAAQASGALDAGIDGVASVLGAHRYVDGTTLADFAYPEGIHTGAERNFDPAIYGNGPSDTSLLPHQGLGKWINAGPRWSIVSSAYGADGFEPLAPGLGALRIAMPAEPGIGDGSVVGYSGTLAGNGMIFMPEPLYGRLDHIFVRYYVRLGLPYTTTSERRFNVYHQPGFAVWTGLSGKFGIAPDHSTSYGGVSGTSGGGNGWQMRLSWSECDAGNGGPDEGGWAPGFHLYDFHQNPAGYNYGQGEGGITEQLGMLGGLGGMIYAGRWYCIETELKLNTVMPNAPGFAPDGEVRAWVDGRLVYDRTGMVFRTLPLVDAPYRPDQLRPCRELGVMALWLNWFHGGKTMNTVDRTLFYTGLVWSTSYIGPMKKADGGYAA
jgi:hypothetical protein